MNSILTARPRFYCGMAWYRPFENNRAPLLCLSGYMDTARTFIFLEEVLSRFDPILLDWRGQGASAPRPDGIYTIQETFADLIRFVDANIKGPFHILGHSMGAALAARYAGLQPDRILSLALLEGFSGLPSLEAEVDRLTDWAERLSAPPDPHRPIRTFAEVCRVLSQVHRGVRPDRIEVLARLLSKPVDARDPEKGFIWVHDPALKRGTVPLSFSPEISRALWRRINSPILLCLGSKSNLHPNRGTPPGEDAEKRRGRLAEILSHFTSLELEEIAGAGHNLHHEFPELVVPLLLSFYERNGFQ